RDRSGYRATSRIGTLNRKTGRSADPLQVLVVIHPHHFSAAHADDRGDRLQIVAPDVHDADLGIRHSLRSLDYGLKADTLLQEISVPLVYGYGGNFFLRR